MSALFRLTNRSILQRSIAINNAFRTIKTSQKKEDTVTTIVPTTKEDFAKPDPRNWVSYGFDAKDQTEDRNVTKASFFFSVTLCLVWGTFVWSYLPDTQMRDWAQREGYLELRRREEAGLDLVNPNYIDPSVINLPTDEELGDTEIII
ncbi:NADH dehydrogenase [ubiquinone] 1 beta subcomplex subunit 11, mitochondrial-like [Teleopsis dalmanni]|uniref:NADH dehydrogenase [ubiquinone] 1 beta subcomplex subunit 11, mitochondrial-like n=1 Tax=Teleopsis dalmanni TaxID=139649 RepID=UPI0018CF75CC|nr:NADH dehydrogenase [ubiquinone] 1 beta subcomplex subunit 11, mitochondrial-like [Teleopsis dalmanni]XP_037949832.1 NADH dehydrogenase [ubiquinone] 1 beta subcomplex subunit 11, mitochondrial-like [Teleopsis dalmanni]